MNRHALHIFLSHGMESGPDGTKIQALKSEAEKVQGVTATALDHRHTRDPVIRLEQLRHAMAETNADPANTLLVGSSMGGWVCAQASADLPVLGCFLLAPALAMPDYPRSSPQIQARHTQIIHGWQDDVVLPAPVIELAQRQALPILLLPDGHRLQDSLDRICAEFRLFLTRCLKDR